MLKTVFLEPLGGFLIKTITGLALFKGLALV